MSWDVTADGERFLFLLSDSVAEGTETALQLILIQNWADELKRLVPESPNRFTDHGLHSMFRAIGCPVITNASWLGRSDFRGVFDYRSWTQRSHAQASASGPQPHPGFVEVSCEAAVEDGDGTVAGAGQDATMTAKWLGSDARRGQLARPLCGRDRGAHIATSVNLGDYSGVIRCCGVSGSTAR